MRKRYTEGFLSGTVICIHGLSSSANVFENLLLEEDFPFSRITIELPGHGAQACQDSHVDYTIQSQVKQLTSLINEIDDDVLLVGNSYGGHLAIEVSQSIARLKGLVICGTPPLSKPANFEEAFIPIPALNTFMTEQSSEKAVNEASEATVFNKNLVPQVTRYFKEADPAVRGALVKTLENGDFSNQASIFKFLKVPKFIIIGDHDLSINPDYLKNIAEHAVPPCKIINFEKCGHYPSLDRPTLFVNSLKNIAHKVFTP